MRVIAKSTLVKFWSQPEYADSKGALQSWYDEALKALEAKHGAAFDAQFLAAKGDVLVAQGKRDEARSAYQAALDKADAKDAGMRGLIQLNLDALGTTK